MTQTRVLESIRALLRGHGAAFREVQHAPTRTSEESARARGVPLALGGKAIVGKCGETFRLFVFSAARRLDSGAIRRHFGSRHLRFASADELRQITSLEPGAVPPFGRPVLPLDLYVDQSILDNDQIAFNAGSLTDSVVMDRAAYLEVARPVEVFAFTRPVDPAPA
jgi:prolyl-tRNA editing enzyme YbaK/EbsC (Cys-tRNA(Pro) deacylase)